jgi:hypothetical protein
VLQATRYPGGEEGTAAGQANQGTGSADNTQDKRYRTCRVQPSYRTGKTRYRISRQGSRYRTSRVQLQDRQNKVQDKRYRTSRTQLQDKQNKVQDQQTMCRIKGTGQAGSNSRTGKIRYRISRQCTGQKGSR